MMKLLIEVALFLILIFILREAFRKRGFKQGVKWLLGIQDKSDKLQNFTVAIMIPAYNEEACIASTIESIQRQTYPIQEIIVIDDSSTDKTALIAKSLGVKVVQTPQNTGTKAQAQQYGLRFINTEIVINVDADTILEKNAVEELLYAFSDPKTVSACGFVIPQRIKTIWEKGRFIQYLFGVSVGKTVQDLWSATLVSSGCFSAFRTKELKAIGGFPKRTIAEDMDVTWQFLEQGKTVRLMTKAVCYPLEPHNYLTLKNQVERWYRGFLQNLSFHKLSLWKNKRTAFFAFRNLFRGMTAPLSLIFIIYWTLSRNPFLLLLGIGFEVLLVGTVSYFKARTFNKGSLALKSLPSYFIIKYVHLYLFLRSIWQEWIKKDKLSIWEKGHKIENL